MAIDAGELGLRSRRVGADARRPSPASSARRAIVAPGTDRGNEVMAHVAAKLDQPMAANCTNVSPGSTATVTRVRWGGSLLEEAAA